MSAIVAGWQARVELDVRHLPLRQMHLSRNRKIAVFKQRSCFETQIEPLGLVSKLCHGLKRVQLPACCLCSRMFPMTVSTVMHTRICCGCRSPADRCEKQPRIYLRALFDDSLLRNATSDLFVLFFVWYCALRQWRRGNPVLDCLNSVHCSPGVWKKVPPSSNQKKGAAEAQ